MIRNAMTVDVEDYFHVSAFERVINRDHWDSLPLRAEKSTQRVLALFDQHNIKATFFVLGWVAEKAPQLVRQIAELGHEVASHGFGHERVTEMSPEQFRNDLIRSKALLEDLTGQAVIGYRAPSFSVNDSNTWIYDELAQQGFLYSSSTYPVKHDLYGVPHWPRFAYTQRAGIKEIPMTTLKVANKTLPIAGGGFFRLYPYSVTRSLYQRFLKTERYPAIFYMHPWELDVEQPRQENIPFKTKFRHYLNIERHEERLQRLARDFDWGRMDDVFGIRPLPESA